MTRHTNGSRDHAGVFVPPPLFYVIPLMLAATLHSRRPWAISEEHGMVLTLAGFFILATGIAIGLASVYNFRKNNVWALVLLPLVLVVVDRAVIRREERYLTARRFGRVLIALTNGACAVHRHVKC